jgi:hypothetical protein
MRSPTEMAAWNSYAETHPIVDTLGQTVYLTGHSMYVKINTQAANAGLPGIADPPADPVFSDMGYSIITAITAPATTPELKLRGVANQPANYLGAVFASPPVSAGVSYPPTMRQIEVISTSAWVTPEPDIGPSYEARWGIPLVGQKAIIEVRHVSDEGVYGSRVRQSIVFIEAEV